MSELERVAKTLVGGGNIISRSGIYRLLSSEAQNRRLDGQSAAQSFTRMIERDPVAKALFDAHQALGRRALTACSPTGEFGRQLLAGLGKALDGGGAHYDPGPRRQISGGQPGSQDGSGAMHGDDDDEDDLGKMVREHMAKNAGMTRERATVAVMKTTAGAKAYQQDRDARLTRALRGG
jgi:hypothetical protein